MKLKFARRVLLGASLFLSVAPLSVTYATSVSAVAPHVIETSFVSKLACPSANICYYLGHKSLTGTGGATLGRVALAATQPFLNVSAQLPPNALDIACPATSICYVVGGSVDGLTPLVSKSTTSGSTWHPTTLDMVNLVHESTSAPGTVLGLSLTSIECASATFCVAYGTAKLQSPLGYYAVLIQTTDGGSLWTAVPVDSRMGGNYKLLHNLTCWSAGHCLVIDGVGQEMGTNNNGHDWSFSATIYTAGFETYICRPPTSGIVGFCSRTFTIGVGTALLFDGGSSTTGVGWRYHGAVSTNPLLPIIESSACYKSYCVAAGSNGQRTQGVIYASIDYGARWHLASTSSHIANFNSVVTPSSGVSIVGGTVGTFPSKSIELRSTGNAGSVLHPFVSVSLPPGLV